jgi:KDO2-lipid IV(A) lauroyltransferase
MAWNPSVDAYKAGSFVANALPAPVGRTLTSGLSAVVTRVSPDQRRIVERNLRRVHGSDLQGLELSRKVTATFESYGRYWLESFRLPSLSPAEVDAEFSYEGFGHVVDARRRGVGPIIALPHLGGWEWAAFWITQVAKIPVSAVVEALEPPELFEWFVDYRRTLGMNVIPLGPSAGSEVVRAVKERHVVCLLSDRDITGGGVEVEFFGERTTLPGGPATIAFRTGAPILPTAVYFEGRSGHRTIVGAPLDTERRGKLRDDVARVTQDLAHALESLIRRAPEQWHLMEPNWPSDRD